VTFRESQDYSINYGITAGHFGSALSVEFGPFKGLSIFPYLVYLVFAFPFRMI